MFTILKIIFPILSEVSNIFLLLNESSAITSCRSYLTLRRLLLKEQHKFKSATVCMLALLVISEGYQELAIIFLESCGSQLKSNNTNGEELP